MTMLLTAPADFKPDELLSLVKTKGVRVDSTDAVSEVSTKAMEHMLQLSDIINIRLIILALKQSVRKGMLTSYSDMVGLASAPESLK